MTVACFLVTINSTQAAETVDGLAPKNILQTKLDFQKKIFSAKATPCRIYVDTKGRHGCYSPRGGVTAPTFDIFDKKTLSKFLKLSQTEVLKTAHIVLLNSKVYTVTNINEITKTGQVAGVIVYRQNKYNVSDHIPDELNLGEQSRWNPKGTNFLSKSINMPLTFVDSHQQETIQLLRASAKWNRDYNPSGIESAIMVSMDLYSGRKDLNREKCVDFNFDNFGRCSEIEGYSVWSTFDPRSSTSKESGTKKIFVTTGIDSTSLFYDKSDGANSGASGYIALLTAIDALSFFFRNNPARKQEVKREIVIGLFNGEIQNRQGSKLFIDALINKCPKDRHVPSMKGYDFPVCNLTGTTMEGYEMSGYISPLSMYDLNENLEYVLSVDQVGKAEGSDKNAESMYIFGGRIDDKLSKAVESDNSPIINMFRMLHKYGNNDTTNKVMPIKSGVIPPPLNSRDNKDDNNVPPSPLDSFVEKSTRIDFQNPQKNSAVLTGYKSTYTNKFYRSAFDDVNNINRKDLYKFSTTLAKALYVMLITDDLHSDNLLLQSMKLLPVNLIVNETLLNDMINCTLITWSNPICKIASEFDIGLNDFNPNLTSKYVELDESRLYTQFAREFLAKSTCNEYDELPADNCDDSCLDCVGHKCMRNSKAWYWKSASVSESDILMIPTYDSSAFEIKIYRSDPISLEWAFVGVGIFLLGLWFGFAKLLIKFKLKQF